MIDHLATLLTEFPGSANRTRCFAHILNLVAKCIMRQFDGPKSKKKNNTSAFEALVGEESGSNSDDSDEIRDDFDDDGDVEMAEAEAESTEDSEGDGDVDEGRASMSEEEIRALEEAVKPVKLVLVKVSH